MPPTTPLDPDQPQVEPEQAQLAPNQPQSDAEPSSAPETSRPRNAPLSFVPHNADGTANTQPVLIRTGRYGELSENELIHLLDSIEDERARSRFRESLYIAVFVWMALAALVVWGPHYLWHAPVLKSPIDMLKEHELTVLNAPVIPHPRPVAPPPVDRHTLEHLRSMEPAPAPAPVAPTASTPEPTPAPVASAPAPTVAPPTHAIAPSPIIDAPTPQPSANRGAFSATQPNNTGLAAGAHENLPMAIRGRGRGAPLGTGVEILSPNPDNVDFDPYLRRLIRQVYDQWIPLIPEEVQPPLSKTGSTLIRFRIMPDGKIGGIWLDGSSHDDAINRAAWGSIVGVGQFEPLPHNYHQPNLELRIDFEIQPPGKE